VDRKKKGVIDISDREQKGKRGEREKRKKCIRRSTNRKKRNLLIQRLSVLNRALCDLLREKKKKETRLIPLGGERKADLKTIRQKASCLLRF